MDIQKLFARIDALQEEYLQFWIDVCDIESPTNYKPGVDAVGRYFIERAEKRGWEVEVNHQPVSGDAICITMNPHAPGKPVCFSGHMDTVHPVGLFPEPRVRVEGDTIYGPGVTDCKGGAVSSFLAMAALEDCGFTARPVKLILQSDEETSSAGSKKTTIDFMAECARGCEIFLNAEPHAGNAILRRKGIYHAKIQIHGAACHAAMCAKQGVSAIREAAAKILEIEKYKDFDGICMNCGVVSGGTAGNVVPEYCEIVIDARCYALRDMEEIRRILTEIAATSYVEGSRSELVEGSVRPPMELTEQNVEALARMNEIYAAVGLPALEAGSAGGGSDAAYMTMSGYCTIDSIGIQGDGMHSIRESARISSMAECAKRLASVAACF